MKINTRLQAAMQHGNLTIADLARWFERPHPTVRGWVHGTGVGGPPLDVQAVLDRLGHIEVRIKKRKGLPVPQLSPARRAVYVESLRNAGV